MGHAGLRHPIDARLSSLKSDVSSARRKSTSSNSGAPPCPWKEAPANRPSYETGRNSKTEPAGRPTGPLRPLPGGTCWTRTETEPVTVIHTVKLPSYEKERKKRREFLLRCSWSVVYVFALAGKERERRHPTRLHVCVGVLLKRRDTSHIPSARSSSCNDHDAAVGWRNVRRSGFPLEETRTFEP